MRSFWLMVVLGGSFASTQVAKAGIVDELVGNRSKAMGGAHRGLGTSNDTLYLNPAGMSVAKRYAVEANYGYSPFDGLTYMNASAVDSKSGPVAGGLAYTSERGTKLGYDAALHRVTVGSSYAISEGLALGLSARYLRGEYTDAAGVRQELKNVYSGNIGLMARLGQVGVGIVAHNVIDSDAPELLPRTYSGGIAFDTGSVVLAADAVMNAQKNDDKEISYHAGAEYLMDNAMPLRLGYQYRPFVRRTGETGDEHVLSGGIGWVNQGGIAGLAYEQSLTRANNWGFILTLGAFL